MNANRHFIAALAVAVDLCLAASTVAQTTDSELSRASAPVDSYGRTVQPRTGVDGIPERLRPPRIEPYRRHIEAAPRLMPEWGAPEDAARPRNEREAAARRQREIMLRQADEDARRRIEQARQRKRDEFGVQPEVESLFGMPSHDTARVLDAMRRETARYRFRVDRLQRTIEVMHERGHYPVARRLESMIEFEAALYTIRMRKLEELDENAAQQFDPRQYRVSPEHIPDAARALVAIRRALEAPVEETDPLLTTADQMKRELDTTLDLDPRELLRRRTPPHMLPPEPRPEGR